MALPRVAVAAFAIAFIVACTDMATDPPLEPGTPTLGERSLQGFSLSDAPSYAVAYQCFTSVADPGGPFAYRYGRMELPAPPGLRHPENDLIRLTYQLWTEGGELVRLANCWIPRSRAAVEWTAAWFRAAEGNRDIRWSGPFTKPSAEDDAVSTTSNGSCGSAIEPCEVRGIDTCIDGFCDGEDDPWDPDEDDGGGYDPCYDCFPDEDPGGGGWNPGDSDGCDPDAIDGPESCQEVCDENGGSQDGCSLSPLQLNRIDAAIDQIFTAAECSALVQALRDYRSSNTLLGHNTAFSSDHGHFRRTT